MTLGEKIQELRRSNAMSQDVLAEKLEVSRQAVSKWERDEAMPETDKIVRIAQLFRVSTDYLLMDERSQPQPQYQPPPRQASRLWEQFERLIRRHGYKVGYVPIAIGAFFCVVALLVMILLPNFGSGMFGLVGDGWNGGIFVEGDVPSHLIGGFIGEFDQTVNQMQSSWQSSVRTMAAMWGIPLLLLGSGMIALGVFIVIKGKKLLAEAQW